MKADDIRKTSNNSFSPPSPTGPVMLLVLCVILMLTGLALGLYPVRAGRALDPIGFILIVGLILIVGGVVGLTLCILWINRVRRARVTDAQMDALVAYVEAGVKARSLSALNLDPLEVASVNPLVTSGYNFSSATSMKVGVDAQWRSNVAEAAIVYFAADVLHAYQETITLAQWQTLSVRTDSYFYTDIVSISTEMTFNKYRNHSISNHEFRLTTSGGTSISCGFVSSPERQRSIQGAKSLVIERKRDK